jgi:hypothetical protein
MGKDSRKNTSNKLLDSTRPTESLENPFYTDQKNG